MLTSILNRFVEQVKEKWPAWEKKLAQNCDYTAIEKELAGMFHELGASLLQPLLTKQLADPDFLAGLRVWGGRRGLRFKEYRTIRVRLYQGQTIAVRSPYFNRRPGPGRRRRRPGGHGAHLGLAALGFIDHGSGNLVSEVVQLALLCPSLAVAQTVLNERGIVLDVKTLRRYCAALGRVGLGLRGQVSLSGTEALAGHTLVIEIDGGRIRERVKKRGRRKQGQKRAGFVAPWREPKLFTIYLVDAAGAVVREFAPLQDATMGDDEAVFALLERYLKELDLTAVARVVFCGDGGKWIWPRVQTLCTKLGLAAERVEQVFDYTHAKQNLLEIVDRLPARADRDKIYRQWKNLLWQGDIAGLGRAIGAALRGQARRRGLKKWANYFAANQHRMQYERFKEQHIPCGSGCVESAIRRVINLRLKSAGSFWTRAMAECFLFLRAQLLSGRWRLFLSNVVHRLVRFTDVLCESGMAESEVKAA